MKKVLSMLLVLCMVLGMSVSAFAINENVAIRAWYREDKGRIVLDMQNITFTESVVLKLLDKDGNVLCHSALNTELLAAGTYSELTGNFAIGNAARDEYWIQDMLDPSGATPVSVALFVDGQLVDRVEKITNGNPDYNDDEPITKEEWEDVADKFPAPVVEEPIIIEKEETYKSVIAATSNGSVKVDSKKATRGEKVTITVTPDKGYELAALSVIDEDGNERKLTENENGTFSFRMPEGGVTIEAEFAKIGASTSAPSTEKENPSTGASDFVGAAAALAVVSVMGMAALSLKK